jgi:hypothetical protein
VDLKGLDAKDELTGGKPPVVKLTLTLTLNISDVEPQGACSQDERVGNKPASRKGTSTLILTLSLKG